MLSKLYPDDFEAPEAATCDCCGETHSIEDVDGRTMVCRWCQDEIDAATAATVANDDEGNEIPAQVA